MKVEDVLKNTAGIEKVHSVVVSLSGGLDSTVLLHLMTHRFGSDKVHAISYDYNQRHNVELEMAKKTTRELGVKHKIIDISFLGNIVKGVSAMVKGDVATPTMKDVLGDPQPVTYVPNRNMILASITAAYAEAQGCNGIALGLQKIDSYAYWDTQVEFYQAIQSVLELNRKHPITFLTPFIDITKVEEIQIGQELSVDFGTCWTCYNPSEERAETTFIPEPAGGRNPVLHYHYQPCGTCPSCSERAAAFKRAGIEDPVVTRGVTI